jgi:hypothetical protein
VHFQWRRSMSEGGCAGRATDAKLHGARLSIHRQRLPDETPVDVRAVDGGPRSHVSLRYDRVSLGHNSKALWIDDLYSSGVS